MLLVLIFKKFCQNNPNCMTYFHIKVLGWEELELSLIKNQNYQDIIAQLKYGRGAGAVWNKPKHKSSNVIQLRVPWAFLAVTYCFYQQFWH